MDPASAFGQSTASGRLEIVNRKGLHARASAKLVRCVEPFDARVEVSRDGQTVGGDSIMGLLMLGAAKGCYIDVTAVGPQALEVMAAITELVANRFDEES
ncbi:MAG: HPr family phosphocarrier protein [Pseudomonadota bacterium]